MDAVKLFVTNAELDAALTKLGISGDEPRKKSRLAKAWAALGAEDLCGLVGRVYGEGWSVAGEGLVGPCPRGEAGCKGDARAASLVRSRDAEAPFVRCGACAFEESLLAALERALGSRKARRTIERAARHAGLRLEDQMPARASAATKLVDLARDLEVFHDQDGDGYAVFTVSGHKETYALRSKVFRSQLSRRYFEAEKRVASNQAFQDAIMVLEGRALFEGPERKVHVRVAAVEGALFLDLGDETWRAVEVTASGWRIVTDPPVSFRRMRGMLPLPVPVSGAVSEIRRFLNVADDDSERLLLAWLVAALNSSGPYPVLCLVGEHGCAKSTMSRVVRALIDPASAPLRSLPRDERDLMIAAKNSWCLAFDNLSGIPHWTSDALCRIATGGGFATRELFTDDGETVFSAERPVLLNGIDDLATRPDLLDRAIVLTLPVIEETARRTEEDFWREFEAARPRILGGLLDALVEALRNRPTVKLERLPRMADFALFVTAAEPAFSWPKGAVLEAFNKNRGEANECGLEACAVAGALRAFARASAPWAGSASELLAAIEGHASDSAKRAREWPGGPKALTDRLRRLAPSLRAVGVQVARAPRTGRGRSWTVGVERNGSPAGAERKAS